VYKERSPIEALDKFDKPIAFFQVHLLGQPNRFLLVPVDVNSA